jgi:hypothetical protein
MLERSERVLKIICLGLAAIMLYELVGAVLRHNPLEHMSIPTLPALAAAPDVKSGGLATNSVSSVESGMAGTNSPAVKDSEKSGTNSVAGESTSKQGTNPISLVVSAHKGTNPASAQVSSKLESNAVPVEGAAVKSTNPITNQVSEKTDTNSIAGLEKKGTNMIVGTNHFSGTNGILGTNLVLGSNAASRLTLGKMAMNLNPHQVFGKKAAELPPVTQARIDKITDSEILGPVIRPVPMGLLGIAGEYAFLRAPSGQTELVKEGAEMGGIKLLKIGINRVLVEEAGEQKELTIFEGYGGETLLPKPKDKPDEIITKPK